MRAFVLQLTYLISTTIFVLIAIEIPIQLNYHNITHPEDDWTTLTKTPANILLIGNSRAWTGLDAPSITAKTGQASYTIAVDGWNAQFAKEKCRHYLNHQPQPEWVIIQFDPSMVFKREGWYGKEKFLKHLFFDRLDILPFSKELKGHRLLDFVLPGFRYLGKYQTYTRDISSYTPCFPDKFENPQLVQGFNPYKSETGELGDIPKSSYWLKKHSNENLEEIEQITTLFPSSKLVFVAPPVSKALSQRIDLGAFQDFSSSHSIPFIDFTSMHAPDSAFYDHTHCNNTLTPLIADSLIAFLH